MLHGCRGGSHLCNMAIPKWYSLKIVDTVVSLHWLDWIIMPPHTIAALRCYWYSQCWRLYHEGHLAAQWCWCTAKVGIAPALYVRNNSGRSSDGVSVQLRGLAVPMVQLSVRRCLSCVPMTVAGARCADICFCRSHMTAPATTKFNSGPPRWTNYVFQYKWMAKLIISTRFIAKAHLPVGLL